MNDLNYFIVKRFSNTLQFMFPLIDLDHFNVKLQIGIGWNKVGVTAFPVGHVTRDEEPSVFTFAGPNMKKKTKC